MMSDDNRADDNYVLIVVSGSLVHAVVLVTVIILDADISNVVSTYENLCTGRFWVT
jgi:archaellum biogenesis protein FlaJ (TadC family)